MVTLSTLLTGPTSQTRQSQGLSCAKLGVTLPSAGSSRSTDQKQHIEVSFNFRGQIDANILHEVWVSKMVTLYASESSQEACGKDGPRRGIHSAFPQTKQSRGLSCAKHCATLPSLRSPRGPNQERHIQVPFKLRGQVDANILHEVWVADVYRVRAIARPPRIVVDIGAHIGAFAALAAESWPGCRVWACECDPDNLTLLRKNVSSRPNVHIVEAAIVGEDVAEVEFNAVSDKFGRNSGGGSCFLREPGSRPTRVPALSIERFWRARGLICCDFLKLDCEGGELPILACLFRIGLLGRVRHIAGEWHAVPERGLSAAAVAAELRHLLQPTHDVAIALHAGALLGYFSATLKQ